MANYSLLLTIQDLNLISFVCFLQGCAIENFFAFLCWLPRRRSFLVRDGRNQGICLISDRGSGWSDIWSRHPILIVPRHPFFRMIAKIESVFLKSGEVVKRIYMVQVAGMDQAHEQITDLRAMSGFKNRQFLRCNITFFKALSQRLLSRGALRTRKKAVSGFQWLSIYVMAWPKPELGSTLFWSNCSSSHFFRSFIGPLLLCSWKLRRCPGVIFRSLTISSFLYTCAKVSSTYWHWSGNLTATSTNLRRQGSLPIWL